MIVQDGERTDTFGVHEKQSFFERLVATVVSSVVLVQASFESFSHGIGWARTHSLDGDDSMTPQIQLFQGSIV